MIKNVFNITFIFLLLNLNLFSQSLWEIDPDIIDYAVVGNDTSAENLKSLIRNSSWGQAYWSPLILLAYHHGNTERSFILDSIRIYAMQDISNGLSNDFFYQFIRGFLGDQGALAGMDTCANLMGTGSYKLTAIELLAKYGYYNHFEKVVQAVPIKDLDLDVIFCIREYIKSQQYRDQCKELLASIINDTTRKGYSIVLAGKELAKVDKDYAVNLLFNRFLISEYYARSTIYNSINEIDPDIKVEMSKVGLTTGTGDLNLRNHFAPLFYTGIVPSPDDPNQYFSGDSRKFLEPSYIKFLKDFMAQQPPQDAKWHIKLFLYDFYPLPETTTVNIMLDTLINQFNEVSGYNWIGNNTFVNELSVYLNNAKLILLSGDSLGCAKEMFTFQKK